MPAPTRRRDASSPGATSWPAGTWLGVTAEGRFAALTNVGGSTPPGPGAPSRGRLPLDFLRGALGARAYAREVSREADRYSGFNLLLADRDGVHCVTNRGDERLTELAPGCHGLGNARLNAMEPKVKGGLAEFRRRLGTELATDELFALLADDEPAAEADPSRDGPRPGAFGAIHPRRGVRDPFLDGAHRRADWGRSRSRNGASTRGRSRRGGWRSRALVGAGDFVPVRAPSEVRNAVAD